MRDSDIGIVIYREEFRTLAKRADSGRHALLELIEVNRKTRGFRLL